MTTSRRRVRAAGLRLRAFRLCALRCAALGLALAGACRAFLALAADATSARGPQPRYVPSDLGNRYQANFDAAPGQVAENATPGAGYDPNARAAETAEIFRTNAGANSEANAAVTSGAGSLAPWPEESPAAAANDPAARESSMRAPRWAAHAAPDSGTANPAQGNQSLAYPNAYPADAAPPPFASPPRSSLSDASGEAGAAPEGVAAGADRADGRERPASPLALPPPRASATGDAKRHGAPSLATLAGSLGVVVGLFLMAAWLLRKALPKGAQLLPREAVEVLGRTPLGGRQQAHLVRCGNKMLLVSVTAHGAETLTEITDPAEVDRLAGICYQGRPHSASANFRSLLGNFSYESKAGARRRPRRDDDLDLSRLSEQGSLHE